MKMTARTISCALAMACVAIAPVSVLAEEKARPERPGKQLEERFKTADTNHDGKLTREEAKGMPRVAKNFDKIDKDKKGYVTVDEVKSYAVENR
jgi:Ca2+-binding EF-hand superfamily protein